MVKRNCEKKYIQVEISDIKECYNSVREIHGDMRHTWLIKVPRAFF